MKCNFRFPSFFHVPIPYFSYIHRFIITGAIVGLTGCSGVSSLQVDVSQPVYFGSLPKGILPLDSAHAKFIRPLVATTSHTAEKEKTREVKHLDLTSGGVEETESSIEQEVAKAVEEDTGRFISDVSISARVEAYVPWYSVVFDLVGMTSSQGTTLGEDNVSSETITITGKIYKQWRVKQ